MDHIAIDLGGTESQICVRSSDGTIVEEIRHGTARLGSYLKKRPPSRVILETSTEAFRIADTALELGHEVRVVPASLVPSLGVGARGVKTDRRDAQVLSEVSTRIELPSVHIPSETSRVWKSTCTAREALVTSRTQLVNSVRGWMRSHLLKTRTGGRPSTFCERVRTAAIASPDGMPEFVEHLLSVIEVLTDRITLLDKQLAELAHEHAVCQRLMTIPGVGPVTAVRFVAALDRVDRFPNAHAVQCYLGLVPGEDSSATRKRRTGITKAGPPRLRWALAQAAWSLRNARTRRLDPLVLWAVEVEKRRGKMIAITALARRLAGVMYAIWRDGTRYEPSRLRPPVAP
jgi:transposase